MLLITTPLEVITTTDPRRPLGSIVEITIDDLYSPTNQAVKRRNDHEKRT
jgi:hypothetical protein